MRYVIEAILTLATLSGYFMVMNGFMYFGAIVASIANLLNIFYGFYSSEKILINIIIINAVMLVINISYLAR
jgi:hypothetical protein